MAKRRESKLFQIIYSGEAREQMIEIAKFDPKSGRMLYENINRLPETYRSDPFLKGSHFKGLSRHRVGHFRIIYRVVEDDKEIRIIAVGYRKSIYD